MLSKTSSCSSVDRYDNSTAGLNHIDSLSTISNNPGIKLVRRIYL